MIWFLGFIFGICLGSLTKVIADRSLNSRSLWGRSYCEYCKKQIAWYDLFPFFSYFLLKARCRNCKKPLSFEYPLIELLMGLLIAGVFAKFVPLNFLEAGLPVQGMVFASVVFYCFVLIILVSVFLTDFKTGYIPDRITYPAIGGVFIYLLVFSLVKVYLLYDALFIQLPIVMLSSITHQAMSWASKKA